MYGCVSMHCACMVLKACLHASKSVYFLCACIHVQVAVTHVHLFAYVDKRQCVVRVHEFVYECICMCQYVQACESDLSIYLCLCFVRFEVKHSSTF